MQRKRTGTIRRKRRGEPDRRGSTYECWEDNDSISFFKSDNESARSMLKKSAKLLYKFQAKTDKEAKKEYLKRQGYSEEEE